MPDIDALYSDVTRYDQMTRWGLPYASKHEAVLGLQDIRGHVSDAEIELGD